MNLTDAEREQVLKCFDQLPLTLQATFADINYDCQIYDLPQDCGVWVLEDLGNVCLAIKTSDNLDVRAWAISRFVQWYLWIDNRRSLAIQAAILCMFS